VFGAGGGTSSYEETRAADLIVLWGSNAREADTSKSFGIFSCSKASNEMNFLAQKFARQVMGTNNIDSCNRT
jgi:formate dehydrogenase major subunit